MTDNEQSPATGPNVDELDLSDAQLLRVLKNHGIDRRTLMKVFGAGAVLAAFSGTASANSVIDPVFGATYLAGTTPPAADHTVELHVHTPGDHDGYPILPGTVLLSPRFVNQPLGKQTGKTTESPEEFHFDPVGLRVEPGDVVAFDVHNHLHTVTAFHPKYEGLPPRVPTFNPATDGGAFTSPPIAGGDVWLYQFTTEGIYDLLCLPHLGLGMVMRIVVLSTGSSAPADPYGPLPIPNVGEVYGAPEMTPANIVSEGSVDWADLSL